MPRSYRRLDSTRRLPVDTDPTFEQLAAVYLRDQESRNLAEATRKVTKNGFALFRQFLAGRPVRESDLTTDLFRGFYVWLRDTPKERAQHGSTQRKSGGIANRMRVMRAFVKWCEEEGVITHRVVVKEPAIPREFFPVLTDADLTHLFASRWCNPATEQGVRNRSLFSLMLDTGLRVSEVGSLAIEDVLVDDRLLRVMGKGHKPRYVPFSAAAQADLIAWLKVRGMDPKVPVYELAVSSIQSLFRDIERDLGFEFFPHKDAAGEPLPGAPG